MDEVLLVAVATVAACLVVVLAGWKLGAWRRRSELFAAIRMALAYPAGLRWGIAAALAYLVVFFVWGGRGGRVHYFYGEWIFSFTVLDVAVAVLTALLMGLTVALLALTVKQVGMFKGKESGVGVAGTLLAVAATFCPWWMPIVIALVGASGSLLLMKYWGVMSVVSIAVLVLSILYMASNLAKEETWLWTAEAS